MKLSTCFTGLELLTTSLLVLCMTSYVKASAIYYFDKFGHCQLGKYIYVNDEAFVVRAHGSGEPYQALVCDLQFQTHDKSEVCLQFEKFNVSVCGVGLYVYTHWVGKNYLMKYDCSSSKPETVCSAGKYMTVRFRKEMIELSNYDFQLLVYQRRLKNESTHYQLESSNENSNNGSKYYRLGSLFESSESDENSQALTQVFIISSAVGSVLFIIVIVLGIILLCICCKNKSRRKRKYHVDIDKSARSIEVEPLHEASPRQVDL